MADTKYFAQLTPIGVIDGTKIVAVQTDPFGTSGFKMTLNEFADWVVTTKTYAGLNTTSKVVEGAINELLAGTFVKLDGSGGKQTITASSSLEEPMLEVNMTLSPAQTQGGFGVIYTASAAQTSGIKYGVAYLPVPNAADNAAVVYANVYGDQVGIIPPSTIAHIANSTGYDFCALWQSGTMSFLNYASSIGAERDLDGDGFDLTLYGGNSFDSGAVARDGGDLILQRGSKSNAGTDGLVRYASDYTLTNGLEIAHKNYVDTKAGVTWVGNLVPPDENDDNTAGFDIGWLYILRPENLAYICTEDSTGAAVWKLMTKGDTQSLSGTSGTMVTVETTVEINTTGAFALNLPNDNGLTFFRPDDSVLIRVIGTHQVTFNPGVGVTIRSKLDWSGASTVKSLGVQGDEIVVSKRAANDYVLSGDITI
jgi:hypothetical protein